ncbi:hypothetical protein BDZ97DRAFT_1800712 [Flammula alnicola]|nr:hypothetical protein BDZ97DRAFT_1800712 [Flammula alnicola]
MRSRCDRSTVWFLASHSFLIRSAAEGRWVALVVEFRDGSSDGSGFSSEGCTMGMRRSCSCSCALRSLWGSGGRRPRSRRAASRCSLEYALATVGIRTGACDMGVDAERGVNLVEIMRMMVRVLERGRCSVACLEESTMMSKHSLSQNRRD